ncbi:phosphoribosylformylglycinamidine synthase subunit PurS [Herbidospora galbida]|uniref:Phosphoribosylformylglycinamidine synthase subunit PurS n=1 Tax=Herbidospora galbida TaxID=2575442 RepID=A0A4U3MIZ3_9ACTN|nr:phosphoribosylformylglycinamidine synthase subunit PurS [Herbidospora galbida]TKK89458.1 phosphoribosylformylglycinamidine synthase subunit PurS [Herbidospora galbida]
MARVIVDVMLKPEILDPQGQAIARALPRLGFSGVSDVRQGKRFEVEVDGPADDAAIAEVRKMAETLLANTVIEDFVVRVEG